MEDYVNNLNKSSIYRNDIVYADREFEKVIDFDPTELTEILGGIIAIIAPTGSGKSILLRDILSKIHTHYDKIYLMCPTAKVQDCYDYFPDSNIIDHFDEATLERVFIEQQSSDKKKMKKPLIILDDIIGEPEYEKSKMLNKIATAGRPLNLTVILISQFYTKIKPLHRGNLRAFIGFDMDSSEELEKFTKTFMCSISKRTGRFLYKKITMEKKFQCCVVLIHKIGCKTHEKVRKYIANYDVPKFKIKKIVENNVVTFQKPLITEREEEDKPFRFS